MEDGGGRDGTFSDICLTRLVWLVMIASFSESVTSRLSPVFQTSHVGPISENFPSVPAFLSLISDPPQTGAAHYSPCHPPGRPPPRSPASATRQTPFDS